MQHRHCFEAVNRTLNDICGTADDCLFGNIPSILGGDFAQILPVVRRGNRGTTVAACLQSSPLWSKFTILFLHQNMRVRAGETNMEFADWLRQMSYLAQFRDMFSLPEFIPLCSTINELCTHVFPATLMYTAHYTPSAFARRAILAMRNDSVAAINQKIPLRFLVLSRNTILSIKQRVLEAMELNMSYLSSIFRALILHHYHLSNYVLRLVHPLFCFATPILRKNSVMELE